MLARHPVDITRNPPDVVSDFDEHLIVNNDISALGDVFYTGVAAPGTAGDASGWCITRTTMTTVAGRQVFKKRFADGKKSFSHVWDERENYSYS